MNASVYDPVQVAQSLGHVVESDPPWGATAVERWTCIHCGSAVLRNDDVLYGSATRERCTSDSVEALDELGQKAADEAHVRTQVIR